MKILPQDVRYVAELALLDLSEAEVESYRKELDAILSYIDQLNEPDTSAVQPMTQVAATTPDSVAHTLREDSVRASITSEEALASAPDPAPPYFRVPKVIER